MWIRPGFDRKRKQERITPEGLRPPDSEPVDYADGDQTTEPHRDTWRRRIMGIVMILIAVLIGWISAARTNAPIMQSTALNWLPQLEPAPIQLSGARLMQPGATYVPRDEAARQFWLQWCKFPDTTDCTASDEDFLVSLDSAEFRAAFSQQRSETLRQVSVGGRSGADFSGANFYQAFLPAVLFNEANLDATDFTDATLEGATLQDVRMTGADFHRADLRAARITGAQANSVSFRGAQLADAALFVDHLRDIDFRGADLRRLRMYGVTVTGDFSDDYLEGTLLEEIDAQGSVFRNSYFELAQNSRALLNANLLGLIVEGDARRYEDTARMPGTALRYVDLTVLAHIFADMTDEANAELIEPWDTLLENSFGDGTNALPEWVEAPCQWLAHRADGEEFYGAWRAWLDRAPDDAKVDWPPLASLDQIRINVTTADGSVEQVAVSQVPPRDDLLPQDNCDWR